MSGRRKGRNSSHRAVRPPAFGGRRAIQVAHDRILSGVERMGAKYLPTIKDLRASQRFHQKQKPLPNFKKSPAPSSASKSGKKQG